MDLRSVHRDDLQGRVDIIADGSGQPIDQDGFILDEFHFSAAQHQMFH